MQNVWGQQQELWIFSLLVCRLECLWYFMLTVVMINWRWNRSLTIEWTFKSFVRPQSVRISLRLLKDGRTLQIRLLSTLNRKGTGSFPWRNWHRYGHSLPGNQYTGSHLQPHNNRTLFRNWMWVLKLTLFLRSGSEVLMENSASLDIPNFYMVWPYVVLVQDNHSIYKQSSNL